MAWSAKCASDIIDCAELYSDSSLTLSSLGELTPGAENNIDAAAMSLHMQERLRDAEEKLESSVSATPPLPPPLPPPAFFWVLCVCETRVSSGA